MPRRSSGELNFELLMKSEDWPDFIPIPVAEHRFHRIRKWRFDFAWINQKIALEIEGGSFTPGGHKGIGKAWLDMEKFNEASVMGWLVIKTTPQKATSQEVMNFIIRAFAERGLV